MFFLISEFKVLGVKNMLGWDHQKEVEIKRRIIHSIVRDISQFIGER